MEDLSGSIPVNIFNADGGLEYVANSYNEARKFLGMSYNTVSLYINNSKSYFSFKHKKSFLLRSANLNIADYVQKDPSIALSARPAVEITSRKIEHTLKNTSILTLNKIKLTELSTLFLYCFNQNKELVNTFFTITEIFSTLFPKKTKEILSDNKTFTGPYALIRNRINYDSPFIAEDGKLYYIAKNPNRNDSKFRENSVV
jgi:hypothetical protein